jgi:hypothetical protein
MHREFVPYEQALELKKLGFDEPCFGYYRTTLIPSNYTEYFLELERGMNDDFEDNRNYFLLEDTCSAPTFSQALRFFRENCGLYAQTPSTCVDDVERVYYISPIYDELDNIAFESEDLFNTYEEAELSTLKSLIEIVKNR